MPCLKRRHNVREGGPGPLDVPVEGGHGLREFGGGVAGGASGGARGTGDGMLVGWSGGG